MRFLKYIHLYVVIALLIFLAIALSVSFEAQPVNAATPVDGQDSPQLSTCQTIPLSELAQDTMPVPEFCIGGLCKLTLFTNTILGAFGPGYSLEVYYAQVDTTSNPWYGGPNTSLSGVAFSDGYGYNGNGIAEGIFLWGTTSDDGYFRIMDDGPDENIPDLWTIESRPSKSLTQASLQVCALPGTQYSGIITSSQTISVPEFCLDDLCMILRFSYADIGAFGPGLSFPVYYDQDSWDNSWIAGPNVNLGGMDFSFGGGQNGDGSSEGIFLGGITDGGGYAKLYDDGLEYSSDNWSIDFSNGDDLDLIFYYFVPMVCTKQTISQAETNFDMPAYCLDSLCTILRWTDAWFGAWGPGFSWPVNYIQRSNTNKWIGGPALCIGGQCFSHGKGLNGDTSYDVIYDGSLTSSGTGYAILVDDSEIASETAPNKWNITFSPKDDLTAASFYICSNTCQETIFMINNNFLPLFSR